MGDFIIAVTAITYFLCKRVDAHVDITGNCNITAINIQLLEYIADSLCFGWFVFITEI